MWVFYDNFLIYLLELIKSLCSTSYWIDKSGKFSRVIVFRLLPMRHFRRNKVLVLHLFKENQLLSWEIYFRKLNWRRHIWLSVQPQKLLFTYTLDLCVSFLKIMLAYQCLESKWWFQTSRTSVHSFVQEHFHWGNFLT